MDGDVQVCSLGVGNVETVNKNTYIIYTKHKLKQGYGVNLILDSVVEDGLVKVERKLDVDVKINAFVDKNLECTLKCGEVETKYVSNVVLESAKNCPTSASEIETQFSKLGDTCFVVKGCSVKTNDVFIPKSVLNNFRREAIEKLQNDIINFNEKSIKATINTQKEKVLEVINKKQKENKLPNIIVVNEKNFGALNECKEEVKDCLIVLSPTTYNFKTFDEFAKTFSDCNLGINLPIIANHFDLKIIDKILEKHKNFVVVSNNVWGLAYAKTHKVIAGIGMNVFSDYSIFHLNKLGVCGEVLSIEQQLDRIKNSSVLVYALGFVPLMTFAHCPYKTINGTTCKNCSYKEGLVFGDVSGNKFPIRRHAISQCYFELLNSKLINVVGQTKQPQFLDLRELNDVVLTKLFGNGLNKKQKVLAAESLGKLFSAVK